jgi:hypothetical protein
MSKPKQWALTGQTDKFQIHRYQAPAASESVLWVELRWSIKRELFTSWRASSVDDGRVWTPFVNDGVH